LSGSESVFYCLFTSALLLEIELSEKRMTLMGLTLPHVMTWIFNVVCHGLFCVPLFME